VTKNDEYLITEDIFH